MTEPAPGSRTVEEASRTAAIAAAVRARREELGLKQVDLADLAGCSERFVHTVEHGKESLRLDKLLDVLEVLGLGLQVGQGQGDILMEAGDRWGHRPPSGGSEIR